MVEIFNYTERIVNMIRPRKLLFMAIGMDLLQHSRHLNQRASRWRRSSRQDEPTAFSAFQVCTGSEGERRTALGGYRHVRRSVCSQDLSCFLTKARETALGKPVSEETKNKKSWDSNAITPGLSIVMGRLYD